MLSKSKTLRVLAILSILASMIVWGCKKGSGGGSSSSGNSSSSNASSQAVARPGVPGTILLPSAPDPIVTYPDPAKTFANYSLTFTAGQTVTAPAIALQGAQNEDLMLIFVMSDADAGTLSVTPTSPDPTYMTIRVYQLRPAPVNLAANSIVDGLVPLDDKSLTLPASPIYLAIGLKINPVHPAGAYGYTLTFTNGNSVVTQPLTVTVWPFALPDELPVTIFANAGYDQDYDLFGQYGVSATDFYNTVYPAYLRTMRQYKINSTSLNYPFPANDVASGAVTIASVSDFTGMLDTIVNYGFRYFRLPSLDGTYDATQMGQPGNMFPFYGPIYYQKWHEYLVSRGWGDRALVKPWDEPAPSQYPQVADGYNIVKSAVPQFTTLCAGGTPDASLAQAIDIWTVYSRSYNAQAVATARSLGQQSWLYANNLHRLTRNSNYQRLIGWHLFYYNFSGYLIWAVNSYPSDPWTTPPDGTYRAGTFIYPNPQNGMPLPTLRLEALRRGFEDYQYFVLLQQAYQAGKVAAADYNGILQRIANATSGLTNDSAPYWGNMESVRQEVGNLLAAAQ